MSWVDYVMLGIPAACLTLGLVHALVWLRRREHTWHLALIASAISVAALTALEHRLTLATTPAEYAASARLLQVPLALLVASLVAFVRLGLGAGRAWLGALAVALRLAALVAGFTTGDHLYMRVVTGLQSVHILGVDMPVPVGTGNPWALLGVFANVALLAFCIDTWRTVRQHPVTRKRAGATLVVGSIVAGLPLVVFGFGLSRLGWFDTPLAYSLAFVPVVVAMSYELGMNVLASERLETALRSSESLLAETLERNELAVAALELALLSWDPGRNKLWASKRARTMFALPDEGGVTLADFMAAVHADDRDALRKALAAGVATRSPWDREFRVGAADRPRWIAAHGIVVRGHDDGTLLVHCVAVDVTARRAAADELARLERESSQQRDELAHLARVTILSELSGSLAHELNQPLAAILGNAQAALRYLDRDEVDLTEIRAILVDIVDADRRAGEVIRRLRAMLRKEDARFTELDLNEVVIDALHLLRSDLLDRRVSLRWLPTPDLPPVAADRVQVQQVLLNLIANAGDALSDQPDVAREITVGTDRGVDGAVVVRVSDNGHGVADGDVERMFEPFVTNKPDGIGLGLSVCRSILRAHHGRIWATRNVDRGTTVHFEIPGIAAPILPAIVDLQRNPS